jgi:hypothetical protein
VLDSGSLLECGRSIFSAYCKESILSEDYLNGGEIRFLDFAKLLESARMRCMQRQVLCMVQPFDDSPAAMRPILISRKICCKKYTWSYGKASDHLMAAAVCEPGFIVLPQRRSIARGTQPPVELPVNRLGKSGSRNARD